MNFKISVLKYCIFLIFLVFSGVSNGAVKFYQSSKVHSNGSISINFTYSAKESEIKNNMIGNLPFSAEDVKKFFYSPDTEIKKYLAYKDPDDNSISAVTIDIDVRDINKISEIKGLSSIKAVWMKSDTGMVFSWLIPVSFIQTNLIDTYQFVLSFEDKIKSTNGIIKDNTINWFVFKDKINPEGAYFVSTVIPSEKVNEPAQSSETKVKSEEIGKSDKGNKSEGNDKSDIGDKQTEKGKTCGIFAIELPVILFSGLIISYKKRKRKNK